MKLGNTGTLLLTLCKKLERGYEGPMPMEEMIMRSG